MHNINKKIVSVMMAGFCVLSSQELLQYGLIVQNGCINSIIGKNSSSLQVVGASENEDFLEAEILDKVNKYEVCIYELDDDAKQAKLKQCVDEDVTAVKIPRFVKKNNKVYTVTSIGDKAFYFCESLESITIPYNVKSIGAGAFFYCSSLSLITLPETVTNIGDKAFCECINLSKITIPASVTSIGDKAFYFCEKLQSISIPASVESIGKSTFAYCKELSSITIPEDVTVIKRSTFYKCENLKSITLPDGVTKIEKQAFSRCKNLNKINIPASVTMIGEYAFDFCTNLKITIPVGEAGNRIMGILEKLGYENKINLKRPRIDSKNEKKQKK